MNDFDYDCMQKKRIAMGAFAHINRKRGGCSLPSDTLTDKWLAEEMGACDATIRREAELVGAPFRRGGRNAEMWQRKIMEWANADAVDIHTADAQSEEHAANDAPPKADKPQMGAKLLHARLEMSGDREALLANLRVLLPDEGQVTVEW